MIVLSPDAVPDVERQCGRPSLKDFPAIILAGAVTVMNAGCTFEIATNVIARG